MREAGILTGRYELIDGEIISKMGQKPPHAYVVHLVMSWLSKLFGSDYVRIQTTLDVSDTSPQYDEPEPDVCVASQPHRAFAARHPTPRDLVLLVEVSDTTLRFYLTTKALLYSAAGVEAYWVVDIIGRQLYAHRLPGPGGHTEITV
jgi:Uma2 family endonuclease